MDCSITDDFIPVTTADIDLLETFLKKAGYEECNHNIVNFYMWYKPYPLWKLVQKNYVLILGIHEGVFFLYMPLCEKQYFREAIRKAAGIFSHYQMPFVLSCFIKEEIDLVLQEFPGHTAISFRDSADYVYFTEKLRTFSGKKLQKKRNHLNAFYREQEGHWQYEELNSTNIPEVKKFLESWKPDEDDPVLADEREGAFTVLDLYEKLPAKGGVIRLDGQVKAFIIASRLSERMCQINIEKADAGVRGLYQAILKEFLQRNFTDTLYVNREDDMGNQNLRQAKMAYYPEYLIYKYRLREEENF
ncbi:MAG: phosphatidylglycerol lysyltransferase domain-containing protein [Erysipelotrichaceae bacterium]|jgi:hypothetical protein|nr:phosphatidylglycerol lysyltransferase domain-containing protein [Erysipelotrichaceae bacterium]